MVQKVKEKLKKEQQGIKTTKSRAKFTSLHSSSKPLAVKKTREDQKISGSISRNIEQIMTARVAHEGGHLRLLKAPENVYEFAKSGAQVSAKTYQQRSAQIGWRRTKLQDRQKELKVELNKEVRREEKAKLKKVLDERQKELAAFKEKEAQRKLKSTVKQVHVQLDDDDVAGDFFDDLIGEDFTPADVSLKPEEVGAKNSKGQAITTTNLNKNTKDLVVKQNHQQSTVTTKLKGTLLKDMEVNEEVKKHNNAVKPLKRNQISKNLHDESAMKLLDDKF